MKPNSDLDSVYRRRFRIKVGLITGIVLLPLTSLFLFIPVTTVLTGSYHKGIVTGVNALNSSASVKYEGNDVYTSIACTGTGSRQACEVGPGGSVGLFVSYNSTKARYEGATVGSIALMSFLGALILIPTVFAVIGLIKPPRKAYMDKIIRF